MQPACLTHPVETCQGGYQQSCIHTPPPSPTASACGTHRSTPAGAPGWGGSCCPSPPPASHLNAGTPGGGERVGGEGEEGEEQRFTGVLSSFARLDFTMSASLSFPPHHPSSLRSPTPHSFLHVAAACFCLPCASRCPQCRPHLLHLRCCCHAVVPRQVRHPHLPPRCVVNLQDRANVNRPSSTVAAAAAVVNAVVTTSSIIPAVVAVVVTIAIAAVSLCKCKRTQPLTPIVHTTALALSPTPVSNGHIVACRHAKLRCLVEPIPTVHTTAPVNRHIPGCCHVKLWCTVEPTPMVHTTARTLRPAPVNGHIVACCWCKGPNKLRLLRRYPT
ncbi:unnamed protein product [Closterium sp. NIES-53]